MNCDKCIDLLGGYLDGELDGQTFAEVERHLGQCPNCASELDTMVRMRELLAGLKNVKVPEGEREAFIDALRSRIEAEGGTVVVKQRDFRLPLVATIALVAVLIIAISIPGVKQGRPVINPAPGLNKMENMVIDSLLMSTYDDFAMSQTGEFLSDPVVSGGQGLAGWKIVKETYGDLLEITEE